MSMISRIGKFFGGHFAPDNTVVPILSYGRFNRLAGPGHFYVKPMIEKTLNPIGLGIQVGNFKFDDVLSKDNIPFKMEMTVLFKFDPSLPHPSSLPQLVRLSPDDKMNIVRQYTSHGVRRLTARYDAEQLCNEEPMQEIERNLTHLLKVDLRPLGLFPLPNGGILIKEMVAPHKFQQTMLAVRQHEATLEVLRQYQEAQLVDQAIRAQFLTGLENHDGNLTVLSAVDGSMFQNLMDMLRTTQTAEAEANNNKKNGWNGRNQSKSNLPPKSTVA